MFDSLERGEMIYVAGPMRGRHQYNAKSFDDAAAMIRKLDLQVINPIDLDSVDGVDCRLLPDCTNWSVLPDGMNLDDIVYRDLGAIQACEGIYMLNGWQQSTGALAEHAVAKWLGLKICYQSNESTCEPKLEPKVVEYDNTQPAEKYLLDSEQAKWLGLPTSKPKAPEVDEDKAQPAEKSTNILNGTWSFGLPTSKPKAPAVDEDKALRYDSGKPPLSFLLDFGPALEYLAVHSEAGHKKYPDRSGTPNWLRGGKPDKEYLNSALRHLVSFQSGDFYDAETKTAHIAAVLWNMAAMLTCNYPDNPRKDETND